MQCISRHLQLTLVESALCCSCLEPLFSLGSQTACTQCTFSTLPGVIVPGTGSQPSYTASSEQAPIHFTAENSMRGTRGMGSFITCWNVNWPIPHFLTFWLNSILFRSEDARGAWSTPSFRPPAQNIGPNRSSFLLFCLKGTLFIYFLQRGAVNFKGKFLQNVPVMYPEDLAC